EQQTINLNMDIASDFHVIAQEEQGFTFTPLYNGFYNINLSDAEDVDIYINGVKITLSDSQKFVSNVQYSIKIKSIGTNSVHRNIKVTPITADTSAQFAANEEMIFKLSFNNSIIKNLSLSNDNCNFLILKHYENNILVNDLTFGSGTASFGNKFNNCDYYIVIKNCGENTVNCAATLTEPTTITNGSMAHVTTAQKFYKLVAPSNNCTIVFEDAQFNSNGVKVYSQNLQNMDVSVKANGLICVFGLTSGATYYISVCDNGDGSLSQNGIIIESFETAYTWRVTEYRNGNIVQVNDLTSNKYLLKQGSSIKIELLVQGVVVCDTYDNESTDGNDAIDITFNPNTSMCNIADDILLKGECLVLIPINIDPEIIATVQTIRVYSTIDQLPTLGIIETNGTFSGVRVNNICSLSSANLTLRSYLPFDTSLEANLCQLVQSTNNTFTLPQNYEIAHPMYKIVATNLTKNGRTNISYYNSNYQLVTIDTLSVTTGNYLFDGGNGTSNSPFLISGITHLYNIRYTASYENAYYKQTSAINMTTVYNNCDSPLEIVFKGIYDGNRKFISVKYTTTKSYLGGLFKQNDGLIKQVYLTVQQLKSTSVNAIIGGVVAVNNGIIRDCVLSKAASGECIVNENQNTSGSATGGIAGKNTNKIAGCSVSLNISGKINVGGISGINSGTVENCNVGDGTLTMAVSSTTYLNGYNVIGGIVGRNESTGFVKNNTLASGATISASTLFPTAAAGKIIGVCASSATANCTGNTASGTLTKTGFVTSNGDIGKTY
ncbi:MAG: hypothetical protein ACI4QU_01660, partial [Christensenellales bacterium]